jgi:CRP/FNR family transcriptional regulator, cyclic AMP receptor protein
MFATPAQTVMPSVPTVAPLGAIPQQRRTPALTARAKPMASPAVTSTTLRTFPMFACTSDESLRALARVCILRRVDRNTRVVRAGESTDFVYLVLSGTLSVYISDDEGREAILCMLGPGELFGEMGVLDEDARSATVIAVTPAVLVAISKADFKRCLRENFDVTEFVMRKLIQRLRAADRRIESLALLDVAGRVVRLLKDMADTDAGSQYTARKFSKQDIAKMVGASREMVSRVMKDLEQRGLIAETADGRVVVRDVAGQIGCGAEYNRSGLAGRSKG